jgi:transposase InsO family protein
MTDPTNGFKTTDFDPSPESHSNGPDNTSKLVKLLERFFKSQNDRSVGGNGKAEDAPRGQAPRAVPLAGWLKLDIVYEDMGEDGSHYFATLEGHPEYPIQMKELMVKSRFREWVGGHCRFVPDDVSVGEFEAYRNEAMSRMEERKPSVCTKPGEQVAPAVMHVLQIVLSELERRRAGGHEPFNEVAELMEFGGLRGMEIVRPNQVWAMDISYIPMASGFVYLAVVLDWATRRVLSWRLSITMEAAFCVETLEDALARHGRPEIFNTDQGAQFTGTAFTGLLASHDIAISMDGKGAWRDNVFVERLWRSVKYEEVYLRAYETVAEARNSIGRYLDFYNGRRPHSSLDDRTPDQAYFDLPSLRAAA